MLKSGSTVFFNLFAAVKPYISIKIIRETPCIDMWV